MKAKLIRGLHNIRPGHQGSTVIIGNFDGVHLGHQALLKKAKETHTKVTVITFEPHPMEFFLREKAAARVMRLREKYQVLSHYGLDQLLVLKFDDKLANLSAEDFIQKILIEKLAVKKVIVGDDFHFGKKRAGDTALLKACKSFETETLPQVFLEGERVSSSRVRKALWVGDFEIVQRLLGRPYVMMGRIVHGDKLGQKLGYPTANIYLHRTLSPVQGIYVVKMHGLSDRSLQGVASVGTRPTVGGTRMLLEVHLFDFNQSIYGKQVSVEFCHKLRDEEHFVSLDLLKEKIAEDVSLAQNYFKKLGE